MNYIKRPTKITVLPEGEPIFSEQATHIEIVNEACGEFLKITQDVENPDYANSVCVDIHEWGVIKDTIESMLDEIKKHEKK